MSSRIGNQNQHRSRSVAVVGLGYVGLPLAIAFVHKGFDIKGIDVNAGKNQLLNKGKSPLPHVRDEEVEAVVRSHRFVASEDFSEIEAADSIIICVPTPLTRQHTPDLSYLLETCSMMGPHLQKGQTIILESSTYPGTTREVMQPMLEKYGFTVGQDLFLGYSPERIDPGNQQFTVEQIPKVISGVTPECRDRVERLYSQVFEKVVPTSSTDAAEAAKILENSYRLINISFINEFAQICDRLQIDVWEVIAAASTKPFGFSPFYPGPGIGGHCIPVDPLYLQWKAQEQGMESRMIGLAHRINLEMPAYVVRAMKRILSEKRPLHGASILVYGITYKKDTNDVRESTAIELIERLLEEGAAVSYHDPYVPELRLDGGKMLQSTALTEEVLATADCVVLHTDHRQMPLQMMADHAKVIFDTRNVTGRVKGSAEMHRLGAGEAGL